MSDIESRIREELVAVDPLPPGAEGDWHDVVGRVERPRHRRRWALAGAAVTAVAAAVIAVLALLPAGGGGPSNAAAALNRLANVVATQSLTPQPGQYLYIRSKSEWGAFSGSCETRSIEHDEIWIGTDGSGLDRTIGEAGHFTSPADRATCLRQARTEGQQRNLRYELAARTSSDWNAPNCLELGPISDWSSLSGDPQVLLQQILRGLGRSLTPYDQLSTVEEYLQDSDAPPAVRATLYRAAALIPDVQLLGTVPDHEGRPGLGVAVDFPDSPNSTYELIFDPQTGELLAEQQTGAYGGWTVYLRDKVVDSLPSQPPGPIGPPCTHRTGGVAHPVPGGSITNGAPLTSP
jgi:hypothetical protein